VESINDIGEGAKCEEGLKKKHTHNIAKEKNRQRQEKISL